MTKNRARFLLIGAAVAGGLLLGSCSSSDNASTTTVAAPTTTVAPATSVAPAAKLETSGVWARTSPTMASRGAVYLKIANGTGADDALTSASVAPSVAATVEVHETVKTEAPMGSDTTTDSGAAPMMQMRPVDRIAIPAGKTVSLEPGGYHIMLLDLKAPLEVGNTLEVTLTFEKAGQVKVTADILDTAP